MILKFCKHENIKVAPVSRTLSGDNHICFQKHLMAEIVDSIVESKGKTVKRLNRDEEVFGKSERRNKSKKNGGNIVLTRLLKILLGFSTAVVMYRVLQVKEKKDDWNLQYIVFSKI